MKVGILREGKTPPDKRVPLTPDQCIEVQQKFPGITIVVQPSMKRCFSDDEYRKKGITVDEDISGCDVLLGVKEVPVEDFIEKTTYLFFSHTIKKQPYNRKLLQKALEKNIQLIDYETLTDKNGFRIIGFGRFAGLVGAYSGLRALGIKKNLFRLKPAHQCSGLKEMYEELDRIELPPVKIAITGNGRVAKGALEIMANMAIKSVKPLEYISKTYKKPIYTQFLPEHYVHRRDFSEFDLMHFYNHPDMYESSFLPFAKTTDLLIAAAYWDPKSPVLFTTEDMKKDDFRISVISDITCDIEGSIPSTKKAATISKPFYDYNPETERLEPAFTSENNITVQAVDNLPNELPKDASEDFGRNLIVKVFPSLFGNDTNGIIKRASITKNGKLTPNFAYLQNFADGKE
ncbi:MAG: alanine dehydrogenase [Draconibacterium sp.]|nr:MAG: alanine dehydrogenase [Draconibacterium sp.]PIF06268.1 MAG: alanine dehydrogenase [Draconibacterium sp.]